MMPARAASDTRPTLPHGRTPRRARESALLRPIFGPRAAWRRVMAGKLAGRVGLMTGTATGIGRAGARLFAQEGAALVLLDVNAREGQAVAGEIAANGGRATFVQGDVTRSAD